MKKILVLSMAVITFSTAAMISMQAQAFLMFEPYIGYEVGTQTGSTLASFTPTPATSIAGKINGTAIGARAGFSFLLLWTALDVSTYTAGKFLADESAISDYGYTRNTVGITAGVDLPMLFRMWAGYNINDELRATTNKGEDVYKGTAVKFGLGYSPMPLLSVNVEYFMRNYGDMDGYIKKNLGYDFKNTFSELKQNSVLVSLSIPLGI